MLASAEAAPAPPARGEERVSALSSLSASVSDRLDLLHSNIKPLIASPTAKAGVNLYVLALLVGALLLLLWLFRYLRPRQTKRVVLNYDVEGGNTPHGSLLPAGVMQAVADADVSTIRQWINDERCVIDASAADGSTALHVASKHGHANIIRILLEAGADALCVDSELWTALHHVANAGHGLCVKALLDAGADPEGRDGEGRTPLQLAEAGRHMGCLRMMRLGLERRTQSSDKAFRRAK